MQESQPLLLCQHLTEPPHKAAVRMYTSQPHMCSAIRLDLSVENKMVFHSESENIPLKPKAWYCRKPNAKVDVPKQRYNPLSGLLAAYFRLLQQARFKDAYIFDQMAAVQHMVATPPTLLQPDLVSRVLLCWFRSTLHL